MDLNLTTGIDIPSTNQDNNQLMLNAIKNKFSSSQTANNEAAFSPPKFNIPSLKTPGTTNWNTTSNSDEIKTSGNINTSNTQLNEFLLKQLQEKHANKETTTNGFVLPQLQTVSGNTNKQPVIFDLPSSISNLTSSLNKLQVEDSKNFITQTPAIDLTTALASKTQGHQGTPPTRNFFNKTTQNNEEKYVFDIPYIDCDRLDNFQKDSVSLNTNSEYCITDISTLLLDHCFVKEPSDIGRFLCVEEQKYLPPLPLKYFSAEYREQKVKHHIEPFSFETKSPDDLVLEALSKYKRRHYN